MLNVMGIHSNAKGEAALADGHAWLTLHFPNGRSTSIGLWTTSLLEVRRIAKDPTGFMLGESFDVEFGRELSKHYRAVASRYYGLSRGQSMMATRLMGSHASWRFTHTCATWATDIVRRLTGEELDSAELLGATNTPRALGNSLLRLEARSPTSLQHPRVLHGNPVLNEASSGSRTH